MIAAVVLAAGASSRFGSPKQRLLLPVVLERVRRGPVDDIVVVLGAHEVETDARLVRCRDWAVGPGASLRCGLAALADDVEAAVVVLADGPELAPAAVARVLAAWRDGDGDIYAATYGGERSHPVAIGRALWDSVPDEGFRVMRAEPVPCDDLGAPGDVDRPDDLPHGFAGRPTDASGGQAPPHDPPPRAVPAPAERPTPPTPTASNGRGSVSEERTRPEPRPDRPERPRPFL